MFHNYRFGNYFNSKDLALKVENILTTLEVKSTNPDDKIPEQAFKIVLLIQSYCHQLMDRHVRARTDTWIKSHIEDVVLHNPMDLVAILETCRVLDLNYGKSHQQTSAMNYRAVDNNINNPILSSDVITFNEQDNLGKAFALLNAKNQFMDKIYSDLEVMCIPLAFDDMDLETDLKPVGGN